MELLFYKNYDNYDAVAKALYQGLASIYREFPSALGQFGLVISSVTMLAIYRAHVSINIDKLLATLHELLRFPTMQGRLKTHRFYPDQYLEIITR
jgi:hypothetical protein